MNTPRSTADGHHATQPARDTKAREITISCLNAEIEHLRITGQDVGRAAVLRNGSTAKIHQFNDGNSIR